MKIRYVLGTLLFLGLLATTQCWAADLSGSPKFVFPKAGQVFPPNKPAFFVLDLPNAQYQSCGMWTFEIEVLGEAQSQPTRHLAPAQWMPKDRSINTGVNVVTAKGCLGTKRVRLPQGSHSVRAAAKHADGRSRTLSAWTHFSVLGDIGRSRKMTPAKPTLPDKKRMRSHPDAQDLTKVPQAVAPKIDFPRRAMSAHPAGGKTTVKVRDTSKTPPKWGTAATIHRHQEVTFLWSTSVSGVASAEWQVWNKNPTGRSVPESAKLISGALEVTGAMSKYPIHFGTFMPEVPPSQPDEEKYWVTVSTKGAQGQPLGSAPRPVMVSFKACTSNNQCSENYFCNPERRSCEEVEIFCAGDREIPGYKGTGYSKVPSGRWASGWHIQGTDGSVVRCLPYMCRTMPDGTPQCLSRCEGMGHCDIGYVCNSDSQCVPR